MDDNYAPFESLMPQPQPQPQPKQRTDPSLQRNFAMAPPVPVPMMYASAPPSFIDKMFAKKKDILKLLILSLAVLVAILLYHVIVKYIKHSSIANGWTEEKEMGMTLLVIIATLLLMWIIKTSNSEDRSA